MIRWRARLGDGLPVDAGCINRSAAHHVPFWHIWTPSRQAGLISYTREFMRSLVIKYSSRIIPCALLQLVNVTVQNFTQFITGCQHVGVKCFFLDTIVGMLHRSVSTCSLHLVQQKDARMCDDAIPSVRTSIHLSYRTCVKVKVKVKQSHYRLGGSQMSRQSAHESGKFVSPTHRPPLSPGNISGTHFC
jgi:hypothetical protein